MEKLTEKDLVMTKKEIQAKYGFRNYKPNKNAKPVTYKGKTYLSKKQCCMLNNITTKELNAWLKGEVETEIVFKAEKGIVPEDKEIVFEADFDSVEETAEETED